MGRFHPHGGHRHGNGAFRLWDAHAGTLVVVVRARFSRCIGFPLHRTHRGIGGQFDAGKQHFGPTSIYANAVLEWRDFPPKLASRMGSRRRSVASYLVTGFQGIFYRQETLLQNWSSVLALVATTVLAIFVSSQLFRWEKDEKIRSSAKLWVLGVLLPFVVLGSYQVWSREHLSKADSLWRDLQQQETPTDEPRDGVRR